MGLSKRAKRGVAVFNKIQHTGKRVLYHISQKRMFDLNAVPPANPLLVAAATEAMGILVKNGEEHNAKLSVVPDENNDENTVSPEGRTEPGISQEPEDGQGC